MIGYTIGILFDTDFKRVALILKNRPQWQEGKFNFPGGHIEEDEDPIECVIREFKEECNLITYIEDWKYIGKITNKYKYFVDIFTCLYLPLLHGEIKTMTDEYLVWQDLDNLPSNMISNLTWLIPFALNIWRQGNVDNLNFGTFIYTDKND
jgi:8-oxo-dGTP pyrophosphatase MutT (NUDIX family)